MSSGGRGSNEERIRFLVTAIDVLRDLSASNRWPRGYWEAVGNRFDPRKPASTASGQYYTIRAAFPPFSPDATSAQAAPSPSKPGAGKGKGKGIDTESERFLEELNGEDDAEEFDDKKKVKVKEEEWKVMANSKEPIMITSDESDGEGYKMPTPRGKKRKGRAIAEDIHIPRPPSPPPPPGWKRSKKAGGAWKGFDNDRFSGFY